MLLLYGCIYLDQLHIFDENTFLWYDPHQPHVKAMGRVRDITKYSPFVLLSLAWMIYGLTITMDIDEPQMDLDHMGLTSHCKDHFSRALYSAIGGFTVLHRCRPVLLIFY